MKPYVQYTAIGDSLTAGTGAESEHFVARYAALAERSLGKPVVVKSWGKIGATSGELLEWLEQEAGLQQDIATADIISLTAGGNDLLQAAQLYYASQEQSYLMQALKKYQTHLAGILKRINELKAGRTEPYCVRLIGLYNPFPQVEEAVLWVGSFNRVLKRQENKYTRMIDISKSFADGLAGLLSDDFIHPNDAGYRLMAEQADGLGYDPVETPSP